MVTTGGLQGEVVDDGRRPAAGPVDVEQQEREQGKRRQTQTDADRHRRPRRDRQLVDDVAAVTAGCFV